MTNASFTVVSHNFTTLNDEHLELGIDIIPRFLAQRKPSHLYMYPLKTEPQIIIVPEAMPYSQFSVYLQTVTTDKFFGFSLMTIAVVMLLLIAVRYVEERKIVVLDSVTDVLNLLMNDNGCIKYQRLSVTEASIIVPLTFVGAVVVNGILSNLQSYLTRPVLQPQISTPEDIYSSMLPIFTWSNGWKTQLVKVLTNLTDSRFNNWDDRVAILLEDDFNSELGKFNRSASFLVDLTTANLLIAMQKRLEIKGFHNPQIRISNFLVAYRLSERFLFFGRLNEIIHRIKSAGLFDLWSRADDSKLAKFIKVARDENDVDRFPIPMFIVYGWIASVIIFLVEIVWNQVDCSAIFVDNIRSRLRRRSVGTYPDG